MKIFSHILVGVDLHLDTQDQFWSIDECTQCAVTRGLKLAERCGSKVTFLAVLHESLQAGENEEELPAIASAGRLLESLGEGKDRVTYELTYGRAWLELIRTAVRLECDLVLIGTHEHNAARTIFLGTTGTKLLRKCPVPVGVCRPEAIPDPPTIMVADDLSETGQAALDLAVEIAQLVRGRLLVVHAIEYEFDRHLLRSGLPPEEVDRYREKTRREREQELARRLGQTDYRTLEAGSQMEIEAGPADVVLLGAIERHKVDLLVMGTLARAGIPGMLVGNTAERLLPQLPCSLLAIKPKGFVSPVV